MPRVISPGSENVSSIVRFIDSSDGTPEQGVDKDTTGLALWYRREGATKTAITPITNLSALDDAHSDGGILHIDDGYCRVDVPDAGFASGADGVAIGGAATGMVVIGAYHPIAPTDRAGTGARTVTVTVNDGTDPVESARVRFTKGTATFIQSTNASGVCTFGLDDATYDLTISEPSHSFTPTTLVVDGNETVTYSMTDVSISAPSAASLCTVQFIVKESNTAVAGVVCKARLNGKNHASDGTILSNQEMSATTAAVTGMAELELVRQDSIVKGSGIYDIWMEIDGKEIASTQTAIPNQTTAYFEDLL